jgi:hypothetical protein
MIVLHQRGPRSGVVHDTLATLRGRVVDIAGLVDPQHLLWATTMRARRDEWIKLGMSAQLRRIVLDADDRIVGLLLDDITVEAVSARPPPAARSAGPRRATGASRADPVSAHAAASRGAPQPGPGPAGCRTPRPAPSVHRRLSNPREL